MILGTISAIDNTKGITVLIDGEGTASEKKYSYLASYVPAVNDRVLIEEISGSYVIMGKICTDMSESGNARHADTATNAENATNATNATYADTARISEQCSGNASTATRATSAATADTATTSLSCSGNAATATSAAKCTGNAATATSAGKCTGNAATATYATNSGTTDGFSISFSNYAYGELVTNVTKKTDYNLGITYVSDVTTTLSHNFTYK